MKKNTTFDIYFTSYYLNKILYIGVSLLFYLFVLITGLVVAINNYKMKFEN